MRDYTFRRGDICWFNDPVPVMGGSFVTRGRHPAVIVSDDTTNAIDNVLIVVPMTSNTLKRLYPGQFDIYFDGMRSRVRCDQIRAVDRTDLEPPVSRLSPEAMVKLDDTLMSVLGISGGSYLVEE